MRVYLTAAVAAAALAGCGAPETQQRSEDLKTYDVSESPPPPPSAPRQARTSADSAASGPDVAPTAAPGVAFNYRYNFRLPAPRISEVQEQHARTCEQIGPNRCRITGMRYRFVNERDIEGYLAFQLDPTIARRFGRVGVEAVTRAQGMLVESDISSHDAGRNIRSATRSIAQMNADLRRLEQRLAQGNLSSEERGQLEYQADELRRSIRSAGETREEEQQSLATTPVVFNYVSGELGENMDEQRPSISRAAERAGDNFVYGLTILFILAVTLAPWLLLALLIWMLIRLARRRGWIGGGSAQAQPVESAQTQAEDHSASI
jgi:hypothetical protein